MDKISSILVSYCTKNNLISKEDIKIYNYGFKLIISDIINFSIVILLGVLLHQLIDCLIFLITLCVIEAILRWISRKDILALSVIYDMHLLLCYINDEYTV